MVTESYACVVLAGRDGLFKARVGYQASAWRSRRCIYPELAEHHLAPGFGEGIEILDLVRVGADGSAHWTRMWPTPDENPRHAALEPWMPLTGTRSSAGSRASSTGAGARTTARRRAKCGARPTTGRAPRGALTSSQTSPPLTPAVGNAPKAGRLTEWRSGQRVRWGLGYPGGKQRGHPEIGASHPNRYATPLAHTLSAS